MKEVACLEKLGEALRLLRTRAGLTQVEAAQLNGSPDSRSLSSWETGRSVPNLPGLHCYLRALDLDLGDLQDVLDLVAGVSGRQGRIDELDGQLDRFAQVAVSTAQQVEHLAGRADDTERRFTAIERRVSAVERGRDG